MTTSPVVLPAFVDQVAVVSNTENLPVSAGFGASLDLRYGTVRKVVGYGHALGIADNLFVCFLFGNRSILHVDHRDQDGKEHRVSKYKEDLPLCPGIRIDLGVLEISNSFHKISGRVVGKNLAGCFVWASEFLKLTVAHFDLQLPVWVIQRERPQELIRGLDCSLLLGRPNEDFCVRVLQESGRDESPRQFRLFHSFRGQGNISVELLD